MKWWALTGRSRKARPRLGDDPRRAQVQHEQKQQINGYHLPGKPRSHEPGHNVDRTACQTEYGDAIGHQFRVQLLAAAQSPPEDVGDLSAGRPQVPEDEDDESPEELGFHHGVHAHRAVGILEPDAVEQAAFQHAAEGEEPQTEGNLERCEEGETQGIDIDADSDGIDVRNQGHRTLVRRTNGNGRDGVPERGDVPDHEGQGNAEAHLEHAVIDETREGAFGLFVLTNQVAGHPDERKGQPLVGHPRSPHDGGHAGAHEKQHDEEGQPPEEWGEPWSPNDFAGSVRDTFVKPHQRVALAAHQHPVGQIREKGLHPLILRSREIVRRRDNPHEIGDQDLARHER